MTAPRVSVIIPAYFSHGTLPLCLDSLRAQRLRDFEIVLVNSSPESQTARLVEERYPEVRFEQSAGRLLPHDARNRGAELARGQWLVFTDPDCRARPDWLANLVAAAEAGHPAVGGAMGLVHPRWTEAGVHLCKFFWALPGLPAGPAWILPTANALYTREAWAAAGPFPPARFSSDAILSWRAARAGFRPWFEPTAVVEHIHGHDWATLWKERLARGEEFAGERLGFEAWPRWKMLVHAGLAPVLALAVLWRGARAACTARWFGRYCQTLPFQAAGQLSWSLGESRGYWRAVFRP